MKYILIASLLTCAASAAPLFPFRGGNANGQATQQRPQQQQSQKQGAGQGTQATKGTQGTQGVQSVANSPTGTGAGTANGQTPTAADLATAVANWMADTSMVSNFLNNGPSIQNDVQFKQAATVAFNAEVDELIHKAIIDSALGTDPNVIAANSTLVTGGAFQDVVDKLQQMSTQGQAAAGNIDLINQNRCVNVLPNIDTYFAATGSDLRAVRPTVCDQTGVAGGVQGTGPTLPGQLPGTPAAAFAAAKALGAAPGTTVAGTTGTAGSVAPQGQQVGTAPVQGQAPTESLPPTQQAATPVQQQSTVPSTSVQAQPLAHQSLAAAASTVPSVSSQQQQASGNGRGRDKNVGSANSATTSQKAGGRIESTRQKFGFAV